MDPGAEGAIVRNKSGASSWLWLLASLLVAFGVWRWAANILVPTSTAQVLARGVPVGNNSDLYPRWLGAREVLLHHRDPYAKDVTREIQIGFYGRPLDPSKTSDPPFQESFVYPLYVVFLLAPTLTLPFPIVQEMFRWLLLFVIACSVPLWMYAIGFRPRLPLVIAGIVLVLSSYPAVLEFCMQNLAALVLFFLAAAAAAAARNWLVLSGFLLALATVKPDVSALVILWFLLWTTGRWRERKGLVCSFAVTMTALIIAAELSSPHWITRFLAAVREYPAYGADPSIMELFLPSFLATLTTVVLVCILFAWSWHWRKAPAGSEDFAWALAWVSAVTIAILPKLAGYNQLLLIPALLVLLAQKDAISNAGFIPRSLVKLAFGCQLWQWITAVVLSACSLLVPASRLRAAAFVPEYSLFSLSALTVSAVVAGTFSRWRQSYRIREPGPHKL
jgi:Glycosyltransferase family 87